MKQLTRSEIESHTARIWTEAYPEQPQTTAEIAAYNRTILEGAHEEHWLAANGEAVITLFAPSAVMPPERLTGSLCVSPRNEAGTSELISKAEARTQAVGSGALNLWARSDKSDQIAELEASGYQVIQVVPTSFLNIQSFSDESFKELVDKLPYRVASIEELEREGTEWVRRLFTATSEISQDVPDPHDYEPMSFEQYAEMIKNPVIYDYGLMFVAMDGEAIVGYTRASPTEGDSGRVNTGLSGTIRSHRRRGVVTALKVRAIAELKRRGCHTLQTENDASNPMYEVNLRLGFKWAFDWRLYERRFTDIAV
ncbi:MAG: GNAT family N-acetyltransferase [Fimbriimonadaceae bacterium]